METKNYSYTQDGSIDCDINHNIYGWIRYTASQNDPETFGKNLYKNIKGMESEGKITIKPYIPPPPPSREELERKIREERDYRLTKSDWTQLPDVPVSLKNLWAPYRQALRDLTLQSGFPFNVVWPVPPE
jgi:hypothetical protein